MNVENNMVKIHTPKGFFEVMVSTDPEYPGVDVEIIPNSQIAPKDKKKLTASRPRVVFELKEGETLRAVIWDDPDQEDYTKEIRFNLEEEDE